MMTTITDVINFIEAWRGQNGISQDATLTSEQIIQFATDLQSKIGELSMKSPTSPNANIILYIGINK